VEETTTVIALAGASAFGGASQSSGHVNKTAFARTSGKEGSFPHAAPILSRERN